MLAGKQTAQQALDNAVTRADESIARRSATEAGRTRAVSPASPRPGGDARPRDVTAVGTADSAPSSNPRCLHRLARAACDRCAPPSRTACSPTCSSRRSSRSASSSSTGPRSRPSTSRSSARTPSASPPSFVGLANFRRVLADPAYLNSVRVTVVFSFWTALPLDGDRAPPRRPGREDPPRQGLLPHAPDLALRRRRRHRRHALALPLQPELRHPRLAARASSASPGTRCSTATRRWRSSSAPPPGSRSATTSSSSSPACRRSRSRCSKPPPSTAPARPAASGPSSSRCSRPRPSSSWSSTPSTPSSTPSASSTPSPAAARARRPRRSSTRSTTTAS